MSAQFDKLLVLLVENRVEFIRVERVARGCDSGVKTRPKHLVFASALPFAASACYLLH